MPFVACSVRTRSAEDCDHDYHTLRRTGRYLHAQNAWLAPSAQTYVRGLLQQKPHVRDIVRGRLAVITGVTINGTGFYMAQELVLRAGMHVVLLGKSETNVRNCQSILEATLPTDANAPRVFSHKHVLSSLQSSRESAEYIAQLANQNYGGKLYVLINNAGTGANRARLTDDAIEYNTGCNFIGTHYFTRLLLPLLHNAATPTYKPRVTNLTSMGHAMGWNFNPERLVEFPKEGDAPEGYITERRDGTIAETLVVPPRTWTGTIVAALTTGGGITEDETRQAAATAGTHVGRSKMAILADTVHLAKLHPELCVTSYYPGSIAWDGNASLTKQGWDKFRYYSPSQGACAALRAALDPDMNTEPELQGAYLHCDGSPWTSSWPPNLLFDPHSSGSETRVAAFAQRCYAAAEELIDRMLISGSYIPPLITQDTPHEQKVAALEQCLTHWGS